MRAFTLVALLLVVSQASYAEEVPSVVSHSEHANQQPQAAAPSGAQSVVVADHAQPASQVSGVEHANHYANNVEAHQSQVVPGVPQYGQYPNSGVSFYAQQPAGVISVVGGGQHQVGSIVNKPIGQQQAMSMQQVGHYASSQALPPVSEHYGQPESASIPANYKPFGSWGLYIGGNPADGYYTNYYKSLNGNVEKQVQGSSEVVPAGGQQVVNKPVALSSSGPMLRQSVGPAYVPADGVYPYDNSYYTPADLASSPSVYPKQSNYETPSASFNPGSSMLSYADNSASKRLVQQQQQQQQQSSKGYQSRSGYVYSQAPFVAPAQHQVYQQPQVVAYPVPVGSQIVGSQPGVDGAYYPYGVHAFTRYAVKPTVVASNDHLVAASPAVVGQQYYSKTQQQVAAPHYFYGYPLSQLHYANSVDVSSVGSSPVSGRSSVMEHQVQPEGVQHQPIVGESSDKSVSVSQHDKPVIDKHQKRA